LTQETILLVSAHAVPFTGSDANESLSFCFPKKKEIGQNKDLATCARDRLGLLAGLSFLALTCFIKP
jgi:hypothetical protein